MNDKNEKDFRELQLKSICPHADEWPTEYMHQKTLVAAANEARTFLRDADAALDAVEADRDLNPDGKRRKRAELGTGVVAKMQTSKTPERLRETVAQVLQKYQAKIDAGLKPTTDAQQIAVYAQIRDRLYNMKEGRLAWIEKNIDDTLISAVLTAPAYLSNLSEAEYNLVKLKLEQKAPPEIIEARDFVQDAAAEIERGWRAVIARVGERAGLVKAPDGAWREKAA